MSNTPDDAFDEETVPPDQDPETGYPSSTGVVDEEPPSQNDGGGAQEHAAPYRTRDEVPAEHEPFGG